ncbi:unnamed protein product [Toxocara canis]|uniref:Uncharacterized protein n=1 Tax=Toxocara canis TaxID=6265 RepID=A0A183UJS9_TOXCA|nr:unnamed protein product [Toxocara canis]
MTSSIDAKEVEGAQMLDEGRVESTTELASGDTPEGAENKEVFTRGRRAAASKCAWASLMGKRGKRLEDDMSDEDYAPDRRSSSARATSAKRRARSRKSAGAGSGSQPAAKPLTSSGSEPQQPVRKDVHHQNVRRNIGASDDLQEEAEWDSEGDEVTYNLDEEFEEGVDLDMASARRAPPPIHLRGAIRGGRIPARGVMRAEIRAPATTHAGGRPSVAGGGSGMLTGKVPDISQATSIIRKTYTSQIRPRIDDQPPLKVIRMAQPSRNVQQQKFALVKNAAGQVCRIMRTAAGPQMGVRSVPSYNIASTSVSAVGAKGGDIPPELREKMSKRVVAGDSVGEYNAIIDALHAELARVIEDRKKVVVNHRELIDQMQLAHATAVDIRESRIRQLEHQVSILQTKLQNHLRREQSLLLGNEANSQPGSGF